MQLGLAALVPKPRVNLTGCLRQTANTASPQLGRSLNIRFEVCRGSPEPGCFRPQCVDCRPTHGSKNEVASTGDFLVSCGHNPPVDGCLLTDSNMRTGDILGLGCRVARSRYADRGRSGSTQLRTKETPPEQGRIAGSREVLCRFDLPAPLVANTGKAKTH